MEDVAVVELATSGSLNVTRGTAPSLTITAGEQIIDRLTAEVDDGVLRLGSQGEPREYVGEIRYELVVSTLSSITVEGSGDARVDVTGATDPSIVVRGSGDVEAVGVDARSLSLTLEGSGSIDVAEAQAPKLTVRIEGSGDVRIDGAVDEQDVELRGSGDYTAAGLDSIDARIAIRGPGEAEVSVSGTLDAVVDGSGEITYAGDPRVTKKITGSGELHRR